MAIIEINWSPDRRTLRQFGFIGLAVFGGLGGWLTYRHGVTWAPVALAAAALYCGVTAIAAPPALRPVFLAMSIVTAPIGYVVSHLILGLLYFGLFTPVALVFKLIGRDAMQRRFEPQAKSYWQERERRDGDARYFRQY